MAEIAGVGVGPELAHRMHSELEIDTLEALGLDEHWKDTRIDAEALGARALGQLMRDSGYLLLSLPMGILTFTVELSIPPDALRHG